MIDSGFVVGPSQSPAVPVTNQTRRRKISESKKEPPELTGSKKTIFSKFSKFSNFSKQKKNKKKDSIGALGARGEEHKTSKFVVKTHKETLPVKIVLHNATTENVLSLKKFLNERLPKIQVKKPIVFNTGGHIRNTF